MKGQPPMAPVVCDAPMCQFTDAEGSFVVLVECDGEYVGVSTVCPTCAAYAAYEGATVKQRPIEDAWTGLGIWPGVYQEGELDRAPE